MQAKGDYWKRDQMVLEIVGWGEAEPHERWPKILKTKLNLKGTTRIGPLRPDGSCGSQAG
jgi:hypothetical protein